MKTESYYEISHDDVEAAWRRITEALDFKDWAVSLTAEDINALARILAWVVKEGGEDKSVYEHVVDFLWMGFRIGTNHKMLLLDLAREVGA